MDPIFYNAAVNGVIKDFKNIEQPLNSLLTPSENTVLHIYITSLDQESESTTKFVEELLNICPSLLWKTNANKETPLHLGARYGHIGIAKFLIEQAKNLPQDLESGTEARIKMLRMMDKEKNTTLHEAVRFGHLEVVKLLIHEDPGLSQFANTDGETPLYMAIARKFRPVAFEIILSTRELQACGGPLGRTVLHAAVALRDNERIKKLLETFRGLTKQADQNGWTPLHLAATSHRDDIVKLLLESDRHVAYMKDAKGRTPLHLAAYKGRERVMKLIISSCPDCCELVDERGWNVFHFIINSPDNYHRKEKMKVVLRNPSASKLLNEKDIDGNTPLHYQSNTEYIKENFLDHNRVDKMALNREKFTAYDIALSSTRRSDARREYIKSVFGGFHSLSYPKLEEDYSHMTISENREDFLNKRREKEKPQKEELLKAAAVHLVVATLITTVTFAAGITLPGGFEGGDDQHPGSAVLKKSAAFKAFVIFDGISMVSSSCAIFIHLLLPFLRKAESGFNFLVTASLLIFFAMGTMVLAFVTGTYVVLVHSLALAITSCVIGLSFFLIIFLIFRKYVNIIREG